MIKTKKLFVLLLCIALFLNKEVASQEFSVHVNKGSIPCINGTIETGEWDDALELKLKGGEFVRLKSANDTLYVAIKGSTGGFSSLAMGNNRFVEILHASTGLISAKYDASESGWNSIRGFEEPLEQNGKPFGRGPVRLEKRYLDANLLAFGWYSNLIEMGNVSEFEYAISLDKFNLEPLYISVVFFQIKAKIKYAVFPENLSDDCLNRSMVAGGAPSNLQFSPEKWIRLQF